jgi:DNA repair photolyase
MPTTVSSRTFVPLLTPDQRAGLSARASEVVEYRKSGLSLNHVMGCPLGCSYCIRHAYSAWDLATPRAVITDAEAVAELVGHRYFRAHRTPLQIFNRATDPFLPKVKDHLFAVLEDLDARGLTNHTLVITRYRVTETDCHRLNRLRHLKVTLLFTYSGIGDTRIEPFPSQTAEDSLRVATRLADRYRTILYWRPLIPGLNDTPDHLAKAVELSRDAHATVFTGLFYRDEIAAYFQAAGVPEPYGTTARRKIVPAELEARVLAAFAEAGGGPLFRKTSCAVAFTHGLADYNGHYGIRELCDICPAIQLERCRAAHTVPTADRIRAVGGELPEGATMDVVSVSDRAAVVAGLDEQPRYYIQHALGFQIHDVRHPHHAGRHGRADLGWTNLNQPPANTGATAGGHTDG